MRDEAPPRAEAEPSLLGTREAAAAAPREPAVDDAGDLRGYHFRRLLAKRSTKVWIGVGMVLGGAIGWGALGAISGLFGVTAALVIGVCIVWGIASSASERDFFEQYASQRGLTLSDGDPLPQATPLLRKGDKRHCDEVLRGPFADGVDGTLALYTYTEEYSDDKGQHETDYDFTVALTDLPECTNFVAELYCNRKSGFRFAAKLEDVFRSKVRVHLESDALDDHYEIFTTKGQDQNWLRQLFSPTFVVWLTDSAPEKFAFELEDGVLCCNVKGHHKDASHLDGLRSASAAVAMRIRAEARE